MQRLYLHSELRGWANKETIRHGAVKLGCLVVETDRLIDVPEKKGHIMYGGVSFVHKFIEREGLQVQRLGDVPECLMDFAGRKIELMTLKDALKEKFRFIKPISEYQKEFTGFVYRAPVDLLNIANYDENWLVHVSEYVSFLSEYRVFVHKREVIGAKHYKGSFRVIPDIEVADKILKNWPSDYPSSFSIDLGLTTAGDTLLVECNDVMSLGWYGFEETYAAAMLVDRWEQIHKQNGVNVE